MKNLKVTLIFLTAFVLSSQSAFAGRYYDATTGRFISVDKLTHKFPSWSPYNYGLDNPLRFIDPNGEEVKAYTERLGSATFRGIYNVLALYGARHTFIRITTDTRDVIIELGGPTKETAPKGNPIIQEITADYNPLKDENRLSVEEAPVERPEGVGPEDFTFENKIIEVAETIAANFKDLLPNYEGRGPNSNSFAKFLIEIAGGKIKLPDKAIGQNKTEAYIKLYEDYLKKQQEQKSDEEDGKQ